MSHWATFGALIWINMLKDKEDENHQSYSTPSGTMMTAIGIWYAVTYLSQRNRVLSYFEWENRVKRYVWSIFVRFCLSNMWCWGWRIAYYGPFNCIFHQLSKNILLDAVRFFSGATEALTFFQKSVTWPKPRDFIP